jgi:hypothetical protein
LGTRAGRAACNGCPGLSRLDAAGPTVSCHFRRDERRRSLWAHCPCSVPSPTSLRAGTSLGIRRGARALSGWTDLTFPGSKIHQRPSPPLPARVCDLHSVAVRHARSPLRRRPTPSTLRRRLPCSRLHRQPHPQPQPHPPLRPLRRLRPRTTHTRSNRSSRRGRGRRMGIMRTLCTMQPLPLPRGRNPSRPRPRRPGRTARRRLRRHRRTPALETLRSGMRAWARARARRRLVYPGHGVSAQWGAGAGTSAYANAHAGPPPSPPPGDDRPMDDDDRVQFGPHSYGVNMLFVIQTDAPARSGFMTMCVGRGTSVG